METQDIEVFLALADELHFGRAAQRLRLSPARVTQVLQRTEREIGGALFHRTSRRVVLTALGAQLHSDLARVHSDLGASVERARRMASGAVGTLQVGKVGWDVVEFQPAIQRFVADRPGLDIRIRHVRFDDPFGGLRAGTLDAVLAWLPVREPDLRVGPVLYTEPLVVAMATSHALASRDGVRLDELGDVELIDGPRPEYWRDAVIGPTTPSGRPVRFGTRVDSFEEMLPILSSGEAVSPVHAHASRYAIRPDITYRPLVDAPAAQWALVWRADAETQTLRDLARALVPDFDAQNR
ncbi:LysR family transcriptional regulator [Microbacterium resistens]|uniref:LysR family transcriptional regulator n=1 Tax=Microbacterium resistens TaxID=156977 RepID=UPI001C58EDB0|nr:LysR family transcriptional regulator [Microbacterium resistens]MBW1640338.1 LysR family transcriptional regulator [Microbacterium resistens]